jgi:protein gp37
MTKTKIEWADEVWNPVTGCTKVSEGCRNCYAERIMARFSPGRKFTDVQMHTDRLDDPLRWKKPRRVFVNSMSDLFHKDVPFEFILRAWMMMAHTSQHTYLILTKRPERMRQFVTGWLPGAWGLATTSLELLNRPIPNIWLGVSAETQKEADARIPILLQTPAAVRFVSVEPMLGPVILREDWMPHYDPKQHYAIDPPNYRDKLDWVICGGESGPGARPMHPDWARGLRDVCQRYQVPFFFKQWGEWRPGGPSDTVLENTGSWQGKQVYMNRNPEPVLRVGKTVAGRELDGRTWEEYPGE